MTDVDEIIDYIKSLRKGFDKDFFQSKIGELSNVVDNTGLEYNDFHTLFKVWLNLSIPIQKWISLGSCLVPQDIVKEHTVQYALLWMLSSFENEQNASRVGFLLGWLSAAMECESIDMTALNNGYEIFFGMLSYEMLAVHATRLVYRLTKPLDVSRFKVRVLLDYVKKREVKKSFCKQLQVVLGLFKSYRPEYVPENIPAISIFTAFKKLNVHVLARFKKVQIRRHSLRLESQHLQWFNPIISKSGGKRYADPLVPVVEFTNRDRSLDPMSEGDVPKTFLDFSDPVSLVHYSLHRKISRPTRLRSLLYNDVGLIELAITDRSLQGFLAHDLGRLLHNCFLELSPYSYKEKQHFLQRLDAFQRVIAQGIPVVTAILARYLLLWNEKDYFAEILKLVEWVSAECDEDVHTIATILANVYARAQPLEQCAILKTLTNMYTNMVFASKRPQSHFMNIVSSPDKYSLVLSDLGETISLVCHKGLQVDPDDIRIVYSSVWSAQRRALSELSHGLAVGALPSPLTFAAPLLAPSPLLIDNLALLMIKFKKIFSSSITMNKEHHTQTLSNFMCDLINCLFSDSVLSDRENGLIFEKLQPQLVTQLGVHIPDVDAILSIKNHLAFAVHTYIQLLENDQSLCDHYKNISNKEVFNLVIEKEYPNLSTFLKRALPELRYK